MGCIWDCSVAPAEDKKKESKRGSVPTPTPTKERERIWLYGAGWLFMIDLNQDLPGASWTNRSYKNKKGSKALKNLEPTKALTNGEAAVPQSENSAAAEENKRKRKMQEQLSLAELGRFKKSKRERQREEHLSGAGGKIPDDKLRGSLGARTFKTMDPEGVTREVDILTRVTKDSDEEDSDDDGGGDDDDDDHVNALTRLRRAQKHAAEHASADANQPNGTGDDDGSAQQNGDSAHNEVQAYRGGTDDQEGDEDPPCYMTNRFRPILGMVPIMTEAGQKRAAVSIGKGPKTQPLEVAIIERPPWDLAMPPKFHGSKEWKDRWKAMNLVKR